MSVLAAISLLTVRAEIEACTDNADLYGWAISEINEVAQTFRVCMQSPLKEKEQFIVEFKFDNYPEWPLYIEFIEPVTGLVGTQKAYPKCTGDSFFHPHALICHPCSRKSYAGYAGLHADWSLTGWKEIAESLTSLPAILDTIYTRISQKNIYDGRMA